MIKAADYMSAAEIAECTRRFRELEEKKLLPAETISDLKQWWWEKIRPDRVANHPNVILFPTRCR